MASVARGVMGMAPADQRIVIRNESTGEMRHGIAGHIPAGWLAVKAVRDDQVAHRNLADRKTDNASGKDTIRSVQNVRGQEGGHAGGGLSARPASGLGRRSVDRK